MTDAHELRDLAAAFDCDLPVDRAELLLAFLDAMLEENRRVNLTAVREREAAVIFHALDSLALGSRTLEVVPARALDIGTGNGFPGVAIACLFPEADVLLMDRTLKKLKAIERALVAAGLNSGRITTTQMDAAEAPAHGHRGSFDLVTARAVGAPTAMGALAAPLLRSSGRLLCWLSEETEYDPSLSGGLRQRKALRYELPGPDPRVRRLVSFGKGEA